MTVRLNKFVADCTGLSRRKADALITEGQVRVNGKPATLGQTVDPEKDRVTYQGKVLLPQQKQYVLLYKPPHTITTRSDPEGRKTVYDLLPEGYHHLDPVGRLDRETSGLLLLTNDGTLIQKLTHPRYEHRKVYRVKVNKILTPKALEQLEKGIMLEPEGKLAQAVVQEIRDRQTVVMTLKTGMNRQIRRMFEALGYEVTHLKRIGFAGLTLGDLRPGQARPLRPAELRLLGVHRTPRRPRPPKR